MIINKNMVIPRHKVQIYDVRFHTTRFKMKTSSSGVGGEQGNAVDLRENSFFTMKIIIC